MKTPLRLSALLSALLACTGAMAADWSVNTIGYRYAPSQSEPGVSDKVSKNILTFTHISGDSLGSNFFTVDMLKSGANDPAAGGGASAQEIYAIYQRDFSLSAMTGNKTGYGFFKDLKLVGRIDASAKNTAFAPAVRKLRIGGSAAMPLSAGFWDIGIQAYSESNHNGIVGKYVSFKTAPALVSAWAIPVGGIGTFSGFIDVIGPKGKDGFGVETKTETLARAKFMFDVLGPKSGLTAGVGIEYWNNKFGNNNAIAFVKNSARATTPLLLIEYKL